MPDLGFFLIFSFFQFVAYLFWSFWPGVLVDLSEFFKNLIICPAYQTRGAGTVVNIHVTSRCKVICIPNLSLFDQLCGERGSYYVPTARLSLVLFRIIN